MKRNAMRLLAAFSVVVAAFGMSAVAPAFQGTTFGLYQAQAAQKKPSVVVKKDSKGRKTSYKKTTYHANGKKKTERFIKYNWNGKLKETEKVTKYYKTGKKESLQSIQYDWSGTRKKSEKITKYSKAGKKQKVTSRSGMKITGDTYVHTKTVVTKYGSSGKVASKKTTLKYAKFPWALKQVTTNNYKNGEVSKSVVSKYANKPSYVPKNRSTVTTDKKVTLESGFLLDRNEYSYNASGKKTLVKVWSPYHQKLVNKQTKKSVTAEQKREKLVEEAEKLLGNPYRIGPGGLNNGKGPYSFDCSGYVAYVYYKALNEDVPVSPGKQAVAGTFVADLSTEAGLAKLKVGDILYFGDPKADTVKHSAIYIGKAADGRHQFIESSTRGKGGVQITKFGRNGGSPAPTGARRIID